MTGSSELQLIAAIIALNDPATPRQRGLKIEHLSSPLAKSALSRIYEYSQTPGTIGQAPPIQWLQEHGIAFSEVYDGVTKIVGLVETAKLSFVKNRMMGLLSQVAGQVAKSPKDAHAALLMGLMSPDIVEVFSKGEEGLYTKLVPTLLADYLNTVKQQGMIGVASPWKTMNYSLKGFKKGNLYTLFAPPKNFKTFFLLFIAIHLFHQGLRVLIITSEMSLQELGERLICYDFHMNFNSWIDRTLSTGTVQDAIDDSKIHQLEKQGRDIHFYKPSGHGEQAIAEVRNVIQTLNHDGQLSLVLWDGHYRSSSSEEWTDVYNLVRSTRQLALDDALGQVPIFITAQEGSKKGVVSMKAYEQESAALLYLEKREKGRAVLATAAIRHGRGFKAELQFDFDNSTVEEVDGAVEDKNGGGGLFGFV